MDTQTTLSVTFENVARIAANTGTAAEQQTPLSDENLMPFYFCRWPVVIEAHEPLEYALLEIRHDPWTVVAHFDANGGGAYPVRCYSSAASRDVGSF